MGFTITREIGIDAGHRIQDHGSKCKNLHGHRYTVQAVCEGASLQGEGEQAGMLLDFGFLKEEMMRHIDTPCDHGMILNTRDPMVPHVLRAGGATDEGRIAEFIALAKDSRYLSSLDWAGLGSQKLYLVNFTPTAENLAKHWYLRLSDVVAERSKGAALLQKVIVWETPNCAASYPA